MQTTDQKTALETKTEQMLVSQLIKERLSGPFLSLAQIKQKIKRDTLRLSRNDQANT